MKVGLTGNFGQCLSLWVCRMGRTLPFFFLYQIHAPGSASGILCGHAFLHQLVGLFSLFQLSDWCMYACMYVCMHRY